MLKIVPKLLLQVPVHDFLVSDPYNGGLKEERIAESKIIISDYTLRSLFPPQQKKYASTIQVHVWLWMLYICQKYTLRMTIM